jgi:hypothetical protein
MRASCSSPVTRHTSLSFPNNADDLRNDLFHRLLDTHLMRRVRHLERCELARKHAGFHVVLAARAQAFFDDFRFSGEPDELRGFVQPRANAFAHEA